MADERSIFFNRPSPVLHEQPWRERSRPSNPALRGLALHYGSTILSKSELLQSIFWNNAGFNQLRDLDALHGIVPRYDPTVIKTNVGPAATNLPPADANAQLLAEDWQAKRLASSPHRSILDYHEAYQSGRVTPTMIVEALLPLIRKDIDAPTPHAIAFMQTRADLALQAAAASTERYRAGKPLSPLDGVPIAVKDHCDVAGYSTNFSSRIDFTKADDSTSHEVVLLQNAGAVLVGKTVMHELGCDITGNNPVHGTPLNPYNDDYYTGGSSSGSGFVVAAGLMPFAQGNDAGGSIRVPSNFCGLYGLKTSHDRISNRPAPNVTTSSSVSGPLAANMVDLEIAYRIMAQPDTLDPRAAQFAPPRPVSLSSSSGSKKKRPLGIYQPWFDRADPAVRTACQACVDHLVAHCGYEVVPVTLPYLHEGQVAHAITILSEQATVVRRADTHLLSAPNKILIAMARQHSAIDLLQAQKVRHVLMQHLAALFAAHPGLVLVTPTTPEAGWRIRPGDLDYGLSDANRQLRNMEYVWLANFSGCPALTAPCGFAAPEPEARAPGRVPIGIMGLAEWCGEDELMAFGYDCERYLAEAVPGGRLRPPNWTDLLAQCENKSQS